MADTSQRRRFLQCPRCGAENLPTNRFCGQCGANLRGESPAASGTALPPRSGALMPYVPGARGPSRRALTFMLGGLLAFILACALLFYLFLASGADRTPARPTSTPVALVSRAVG